ncbi:MAG TPA: class I SAM-dependent methyltransferase [Acidisphaera sp.]|nr:class I SAM-dependent methyltransferase [Acidisphaera sp.]
MGLLKEAGVRIPAIRRLYASRNALLAERDGLREQCNALSAERDALRVERDALRSECDADAEVREVRADGRLVITHYPYHPTRRPIEQSAGGRRLIARLEAEEERYAATLEGIARHIPSLTSIPRTETDPERPHWANAWMPPFDGAALYGLVAETSPRRYIEVGSGNSTLFVRQAIRDHRLPTEIVSIDPQPRAEIDRVCDRIVRRPLEQVPGEFWSGVTASDMLFIDSSHSSYQGSDVTVFFTEIMPGLKPGVLWGLHDIDLPWDYLDSWCETFCNEQYLLLAYLLGGACGDEIVLPTLWASRQPRLRGIMRALWERDDLLDGTFRGGSSFWLRRTANVAAFDASAADPVQDEFR